MATRKNKTVAGPSVVKGTHLTVITDENGKTTLEWDDEALLQEVREAIASVTTASKKSKKFNYSEPKEIVNEDGGKSLEVRVTKKAPAKKTTAKKKTK
jgi:YD repeat-containing protein